MTIVLLVIGLLATAAGFVTIGFGIPINAFSLGNTLIIAGSVTVAAGLILIGLAAVLGQLRRIAEALGSRPVSRAGRAVESVEPMVPPTARMAPAAAPSPVPTRMPAPPRPPEMHEPPPPPPEPPRMAEPRHPEPRPEPRFPATAPSEPAGPLDWLRSKPKAAAPSGLPAAPDFAEPSMVEVPDEAPLSPRPPQRPAPPPMAEPALEPKSWSQSRSASPEPRPAPRAEQPLPRATPQVEASKTKDDFNLVWPDRAAVDPGKRAEPPKPEATPDMQPMRARESRPPERRSEAPAKPAERGPAILKSGVIDGMPYTLYADGAIEAELPQGTVKFASVDALRAHLEKHG